ncbi:TetR family transcriptional regulator [Gordonia sp. (in: high G+C Gram-positive bacteria)]|uniref:TetR family transcriptional regulator n=1 Tax=Gordonia sp. (in: high G+C Gram-positive bacteria) TaxID=84139 RepID=UPI0026387D43|nr:TetR family transcriptional regulator [Gordonia sp. (in: high G+C Gram-positive bacteria)]
MTEQVDVGVGETVRGLRRERGVTLRSLAARVGISPGTLSAIENGKVAVTLDRLGQLADALDVVPAALIEPPAVAAPVPSEPLDGDWTEFAALDLDPVLAAAVEVFAETGYHGATMRVVAAAADLSVAGIYRHYRGKQHLLVALADAQLADLGWRIEAAEASAEAPAAAFAAMVRALVLCQVRRRDLAFIVETELRSLQEPDRSRIDAARRAVDRRFAEVARAAVRTGRFAVADPGSGAQAVVSLCRAIPFRFAGGPLPDGRALAVEYAGLALSMMSGSVQPD